MKKALEAALLLAVLALGAYLVRQALVRRELAARAAAPNPALAPGPDVATPGAPYVQQRRGVEGLPMVKLSKPPKATRRAAAVPPPAAVAP